MTMDDELYRHQLVEEKRLNEIEFEMKEIKTAITQLQIDVADLVSAWKAASWLVAAVKWVGGIAISITAIIVMLKGRL